MKKTHNVKATKLMVDDHFKIAGKMYRIVNLSRSYGRGNDRVTIYLRSLESKKRRRTFRSVSGPATDRFTIYNQ